MKKTLNTTWNGFGWLVMLLFIISPIFAFSAGLAFLTTSDLLVLPILLIIYAIISASYLIGLLFEIAEEKKKKETEKPLPIGIVLDTEENRKRLGQYIDEKV